VKLQESDKDKIRKLYTVPVSADIVEATEFVNSNSFEFANIHHEIFSKNYLGQLLNHHSFSNDDFSCAVGIYESVDDASFYVTSLRYLDETVIKKVFNEVLKFCESRGRYRFFIVLPKNYNNLELTLLSSPDNYNVHTEYIVVAKNKCKYSFSWQILFNRRMSTIDTKVLCFSLKESMRKDTNGGFE
jgi:hypothetical protein